MAEKDKKGTKESVFGRPSVMTDKVLQDLKFAFSMGCPDREACAFANISTTALYDYQQKHPEFAEQKADLKDNIKMHARTTLARDIMNGDVDSAKWFLERKLKKEFSTRLDLTSDDQAITPSLEVNFVAAGKKTEDKG